MDRRKMILSTGAFAATGVLAGVAHGQETKESTRTSSHLDKMHAACLAACQQCETTCNETVHYCMTHLSQGHKEHAACAAVAMSCQEFCSLATQLIARSCTLAPAACEACAKACDACASECEKMKTDEPMAACAKTCRECAVACRKMT